MPYTYSNLFHVSGLDPYVTFQQYRNFGEPEALAHCLSLADILTIAPMREPDGTLRVMLPGGDSMVFMFSLTLTRALRYTDETPERRWIADPSPLDIITPTADSPDCDWERLRVKPDPVRHVSAAAGVSLLHSRIDTLAIHNDLLTQRVDELQRILDGHDNRITDILEEQKRFSAVAGRLDYLAARILERLNERRDSSSGADNMTGDSKR